MYGCYRPPGKYPQHVTGVPSYIASSKTFIATDESSQTSFCSWLPAWHASFTNWVSEDGSELIGHKILVRIQMSL
jgi:hypothetical protein